MIPHGNEKYRCDDCKKYFHQLDVQQTWKCPSCHEPVKIKVEINGYDHSCNRLKPHELEIGNDVTLEGKHIHSILNIIQTGDSYRVALEQYGTKVCGKNEFLTVIDGAWIDKKS